MNNKWGFQTDLEFIDRASLSDGDMAVIFEIRDDIIRIENMKCKDKALLSAFAAYIYIRTQNEQTKRDVDQALH